MDQHSSPLQPLLRKLEQFNTFEPSDRRALLALPYRLKKYEPLSYIVRDGDKPTHSCALISGFAFRQKIVADGGRSISSIHMRGDIIDLQNSLLRTADHNVQTLTRCEVAAIPREAIVKLAFEHPRVGMAMWCDTLVDASVFREWIANIARRDASSRIAHLLCEFAVRLEAAGLGDKLNYELPMTQEQLADCTGLTSIHVNRTLKSLEERGDITRSKRHIGIADWDRLRNTADFRSSYLHMPELAAAA